MDAKGGLINPLKPAVSLRTIRFNI